MNGSSTQAVPAVYRQRSRRAIREAGYPPLSACRSASPQAPRRSSRWPAGWRASPKAPSSRHASATLRRSAWRNRAPRFYGGSADESRPAPVASRPEFRVSRGQRPRLSFELADIPDDRTSLYALSRLQVVHELVEISIAFRQEFLAGSMDFVDDGILGHGSSPIGFSISSSGVTMTGVPRARPPTLCGLCQRTAGR